jgi:hypothetical protein
VSDGRQAGHLLVVLRWLNPDRHPVIAMRVIP